MFWPPIHKDKPKKVRASHPLNSGDLNEFNHLPECSSEKVKDEFPAEFRDITTAQLVDQHDGVVFHSPGG